MSVDVNPKGTCGVVTDGNMRLAPVFKWVMFTTLRNVFVWDMQQKFIRNNIKFLKTFVETKLGADTLKRN